MALPPGYPDPVCTGIRGHRCQTRDQAAAPVYVSGIDWGSPGFGDTQITKNLQQCPVSTT
jgi:hypothetical protein